MVPIILNSLTYMVSPHMKTIDCPRQAAPGLGTLSSQEPHHTSEMLSFY